MQGYNHARREMGKPPLVEISDADLNLMRSAHCAKPDGCPVCTPEPEAPKPLPPDHSFQADSDGRCYVCGALRDIHRKEKP